MTKASAGAKARPYHHGDLKNALVAGAIALIADKGARALSLREVARIADVSHASAYRHFQNKESLLAVIAEQGFRRLTAAMRAAAEAIADDPVGSLKATGVAYVDFAVSFPQHLQVMFGGWIADHSLYPSLAEAANEAYQVLESGVRAGQVAGKLRGGDAGLMAIAAWTQAHGLALLIALGPVRSEMADQTDHRALAAAITQLQFEGFRTPS